MKEGPQEAQEQGSNGVTRATLERTKGSMSGMMGGGTARAAPPQRQEREAQTGMRDNRGQGERFSGAGGGGRVLGAGRRKGGVSGGSRHGRLRSFSLLGKGREGRKGDSELSSSLGIEHPPLVLILRFLVEMLADGDQSSVQLGEK